LRSVCEVTLGNGTHLVVNDINSIKSTYQFVSLSEECLENTGSGCLKYNREVLNIFVSEDLFKLHFFLSVLCLFLVIHFLQTCLLCFELLYNFLEFLLVELFLGSLHIGLFLLRVS